MRYLFKKIGQKRLADKFEKALFNSIEINTFAAFLNPLN